MSTPQTAADSLGPTGLSYVQDGDDFVVGRPGTETFVVLPSEGAQLLRRLEAGTGPDEVGQWFEQTYGYPVDVPDFVATIAGLGLLDGGADDIGVPAAVRWQRLGWALFHPVSLIAQLAVIVAALVTIVVRSDVRPGPHQLFFTSSIIAVLLLATVGQIPLLLAHETFHALAGRRLGVPSRLIVTRRLYFVVFETDLTGLLALPRAKRYLCFVAGMLFDLTALSVTTLVAASSLHEPGARGTVGRLALAMGFPIVIRLAYQFVFFLRTDLYYLITTAVRAYDLDGASTTILVGWRDRLLRRPTNAAALDEYTPRDVRLARLYAPVRLFGVAVLLAIWIFGLVPAALQAFSLVIDSLKAGRSDPHLLDRLAVTAVTAVQLLALTVLFVRERRGRAARALMPARH